MKNSGSIIRSAFNLVPGKSFIAKRKNAVLKRALDVSLASSVLPLATTLGALYWASGAVSGRAVWLSHIAARGRNGREFKKYLFSTKDDSEPDNPLQLFLESIKVTEYPVLLNILRGDMSVVGPLCRPVDAPDSSVFSARPGLTNDYVVKKLMNIAYESQEAIEEAMCEQQSAVRDVATLAKMVPAVLLGNRNTAPTDSLNILGFSLQNTTMENAVAAVLALTEEKHKQVAFLNPHCFNVSLTDDEYRNAVSGADLLFPDGIGIQLATRITGDVLWENINGTDMFPVLCKEAVARNKTLGLLGGKPGIVEKVAENMRLKHPGLNIVFTHHGYFSKDSSEERNVIAQIDDAAPDILLVAMGVPLQELWIAANKDQLNVGVAMGVGGLFDFYSDTIKRAPVWMREIGMEWFWRFMMEPNRMFSRYFVGNPKFLYFVFRDISKQRHSNVVLRFSDLTKPYNHKLEVSKVALRKVLWWALSNGALELKRLTDVVGASAGIVILSPLFLGTAIAIKIEDGGPILYKQPRVGRHGREFDFYKFRSMVPNASELKKSLAEQNESEAGVIFKMKNDPRITRTGRFIRKYSIDELPQLFNVLVGDMSLVGPRPPLPSEVSLYKVGDRYRLEVTPGLTCLWQVKGRSELDFNAQIQLDSDYIRSRGFLYDIGLILRTIPVVLTGQGAY